MMSPLYIREHRERKGWQPKQLQEAASVDQASLSQYETHERNPSTPARQKIANALGIEERWLFFHPDEVPVDIPIVSTVPGGDWQDGCDQADGEGYPTLTLPTGALQALEVEGNSMSEIAPDGSYILVRKVTKPGGDYCGKFVVAELAGEITFKRLSKDGQRLEPCSHDPRFKPITIGENECKVLAEVVAVFRDVAGEK